MRFSRASIRTQIVGVFLALSGAVLVASEIHRDPLVGGAILAGVVVVAAIVEVINYWVEQGASQEDMPRL